MSYLFDALIFASAVSVDPFHPRTLTSWSSVASSNSTFKSASASFRQARSLIFVSTWVKWLTAPSPRQRRGLLLHRARERHRLGDRVEHTLGGEDAGGAVAVVLVEQSAHHGLLDLRSGESLGLLRDLVQVELRGVAPAALHVDGADLPALRQGGQVDEEDLVEAALAHHLGRQLVHVVGGGDDEHRAGLLLQPGDEAAEHARGGAGVGLVGGAGAGEALLQLVHPQDRGRDRLGHLDGPAHVLFRGADDPGEHLAHVEAQERQPPGGAHRLGGERLAAARDADHENALGARQPELARLLAERGLALLQPGLQLIEAADVVHLLLRAEELEHAALADDALLLAEDHVDVEGPGLHQRLGEDVLRLVGGEPQRRLDHVLPLLPAGGRLVGHHAEDAVEDGPDLGQLGQRVLDDRDLLVTLGRDDQHRRDEEDRLQRLLQVAPQVAQQPHHLGVLGEGVQVAQDEDRALVLLRLQHEAQRLERVLRVALGLRTQAHALGDAPGVDLGLDALVALAALQDPLDRLLDPLLLGAEDVDERVAGPHQVLEVLVDAAQLGGARDLLGHFLRLAGERHRGRARERHGGRLLGAERVGLEGSHGAGDGTIRPEGRSNGGRAPPCRPAARALPSNAWSSPRTRTRWRCSGCATRAASTATASRTARWPRSTRAGATGSRWWWRRRTSRSPTWPAPASAKRPLLTPRCARLGSAAPAWSASSCTSAT